MTSYCTINHPTKYGNNKINKIKEETNQPTISKLEPK